MIGGAIGTAGRPQQRSQSASRYPAPDGGIDLRSAIDHQELNFCVYTYNLIPSDYGMRVRDGYREWEIDVESAPDLGFGVHTLIPFDSVDENGVGDKLFAVTNEGIWDVTDYDTAPLQVATFANQDPDAGYGTFTHYVNQAEDDVLFYADNINGLWEYDAGAWTVPTGITGIDVADIKFVMSHKDNVWFALKGSTIGYYLPILANSGQVSEQYFGDKFQHGGTLEGLFSWTVDGGAGVDDILVVVSHAGDVIMYTGAGPDAATWSMRGLYYIGEIPNTPRFGSESGGELYLLSSYGVVSMGDLLKGVDTAAILAAEGAQHSLAFRVAGLIREDMKAKIDLRGWDVQLLPSEGGILISTPTAGSDAPIQYFYNLASRGWGIWRGVPLTAFAPYSDHVYLGTADNRVMKMDVTVDNLLLTLPEGDTVNGQDIEFSILTAYSSMGLDAVYKKVVLIRPDFLATLAPSHQSQARYDFDISEADATSALNPPVTGISEGIWGENDVGPSNWDQAVWSTTNPTTYPTIGASWGTGRYVAIATKGFTRTTTRVLGWDIIYTNGGVMI
jgi:hypothetical protein